MKLGQIGVIATAGTDPDVLQFLAVTGITDATQKAAITTLVGSLKSNGLWPLMHAIYPMVGGTAARHSYNLKNTSQYQITWSGTITHNANGITGNGSTGSGDTNLNPSTVVSLNSTHLSCYCRTSAGNQGHAMHITASSSSLSLNPNMVISSVRYLSANINTGGGGVYSITNSLGFHCGSRIAFDNTGVYQNATKLGTDSGNSSFLPNANLRLLTNNSVFSNSNYAFFTVGAGLSDGQASTLYTIIQNFQTTLGRQV